MNYIKYLFGEGDSENTVMDKAPSRDAYVVLCNDSDGRIPEIINAIGKHGNGGHSFGIVIDEGTEDAETFGWDGDGSDRIDGIIKLNGEEVDKDGKDALINMLLHVLDSIRWQAEGVRDLEKPDLIRELQGVEDKPMTREEMLKVFDDIIHDTKLCLSGSEYVNEEHRALNSIKEYCKNELVAIGEGRRSEEESGSKDVLEHIKGIAESALDRKKKK